MQLLRDIALFVEVVNMKSFTRAASNLDMPPSTLSRRIAGLERHIGLRLLNRTTRRVEVSDAGAAYYARCAHLVEEAQVAHEQLAETATVARGTLRVACSGDFAALHLPVAVTEFVRRYPEINLEFDLSPRIADLMAENLDAALRIGTLADSTLVARRIATLRLSLYAAPSYLTSNPPPRKPEDLSHHQCIRMRADEAASHWLLSSGKPSRALQKKRVAVTGKLVANSVSMIRQLTLLGAGIGVIDQGMANDDVAHGRLVPVLTNWELAPVAVHLVTAARLMPARVRVFGDFLTEWFSDNRRAPHAPQFRSR